MMSSKTEKERKVINEMSVLELQKIQASMPKTNSLIIIKFGADWCGPCKKIAPLYYEFIKTAPEEIIFADIDVDDNLDLYINLKRNKMVSGIPVFLAYYAGVKRDKWFIPDDSVVGADEKVVLEFFARCVKKVGGQDGYTYFT